jgi:hypothetical protein
VRTSNIQSSLAFVMIHGRVRPQAFSFSRHVICYTLNSTHGMYPTGNLNRWYPTCVCMYSLHILCTGCLWPAPFWIAPAQLCAQLLGSTCWIVCPSLERNERGMNMQNKMRKTKAENRHRQTKEWQKAKTETERF